MGLDTISKPLEKLLMNTIQGHGKMIKLTLEQYNKIRRLSDFADFYLDDHIPSSDFYQEQYENDKEDVLLAQEVFQEIDARIQEGL